MKEKDAVKCTYQEEKNIPEKRKEEIV